MTKLGSLLGNLAHYTSMKKPVRSLWAFTIKENLEVEVRTRLSGVPITDLLW